MVYLFFLLRCLALPALVLALELVVRGWNRSSVRHLLRGLDGSRRTDLICFLGYGLGAFSTVVSIGSFGVGYLVGQLTQIAIHALVGLNCRIDTGDAAINLAIYYIVYSFLEYWNHRLFHCGPFWHLHRIHHSATSLNPFVEHRNHPAQHALEPLLLAWPLGLISAPGEAVVILALLLQFYQLLVHADLPWTWGWFGRWVLIPPAAHRVHHSADPEHYGKNFGVLAIWDHIFGTRYHGEKAADVLGVAHDLYNENGFFSDCLRDYRSFAAALVTVTRRHDSAPALR